jgi:hypothetical protein
LFCLKFWGLYVAIAIKGPSLAKTDLVNHAVPVKGMVIALPAPIQPPWPIAKQRAGQVRRYGSRNLLDPVGKFLGLGTVAALPIL